MTNMISNEPLQFPREVLPPIMQDIIEKLQLSNHFNPDYTAGGMLLAIASLVGKTHYVEPLPGWREYPNMYIAFVGEPGVCKSAPISFCMRPLRVYDDNLFKLYIEALNRYDLYMAAKPSDRPKDGPDHFAAEPVRRCYMVENITAEGLASVLYNNPRGITLYNDELAGFFANINRYTSGSNVEMWLSAFNHQPLKIDRKKGRESILVSEPVLSVGGTIQPKVLEKYFTEALVENGFLQRFLFIYPPEQTKKPFDFSACPPNYDLQDEWHEIANRLVDGNREFFDNPTENSCRIPFTDEAIAVINEWSKHTTEMINSSQSTVLKAISSKLDIYLLRFCIILAMADWACAESCPKEVSSDVAERAIKLVEYFLNSTLRIYRSANDNNLTEAQQMVYDAIPVKFATKEAIEIAARYKMSERAFRKFLKANLGTLFKLYSYGVYTKLIV